MRAGLSTIQQTLTPEAASVLTHSIAEAARRNHGQTTPLHVAATLLAAPSGLLRQACVRSHPNSSHPLQCRALELCFSVALDRLPSNPTNPSSDSSSATGSTNPPSEPPISNALMAALKRAQAHQRRGCPEQQQQPLLAVKVELEQLIVSILDDPSVSRVMREASFSSPAVKATIEKSLASISTPSPSPNSPSPSSAVARNLYMNPRLQQQRQGNAAAACDSQRKDEVKRVLDILMRTRKRNPVLVGDSDQVSVMKEVLQRIDRRELGSEAPLILRSSRIISLEKEFACIDRSQIPSKIKEMGVLIDTQIRSNVPSGVILDMGDLKWLVESPGVVGGSMGSSPIQQQQLISEMGRAAVAEIGRILARSGDAAGGSGSRIWMVGTASCATYLRCQVYHPTMESEWDLQAVPIAPRSPLPGLFPRMGNNGILSSSVEALTPPKGFPSIGPTTIPLRRPLETTNITQKPTLCSVCTENYERELAKLVAKEFEKSSSDSSPESGRLLPHWLQIATPGTAKSSTDQIQTKEQELRRKQSIDEHLKKWLETCSRLHPVVPRQPFHPKLALSQSLTSLQMSNRISPVLDSVGRPTSPPRSPVKTDLILGHASSLERAHRERIKEFSDCKQDEFSDQQRDKDNKVASFSDSDSLKRLFKGLMEKVVWQPDAASAIANVVMQCKSGHGKRRGIGPKSDTWLLFMGPDKVGKRKIAHALSDLVFGTAPITIRLGNTRTTDGKGGREESVNLRGKASMDRVAEAVWQNPFSLILLEDVDRADVVVRGSIKQAIERGRLLNSYGREVGLGSAIFVLTADWLPDELKNSQEPLLRLEEKILDRVNSGGELELLAAEKTGKRQAEWLLKESNLPIKLKKECHGLSLSLDLNLAAGNGDDDAGEGSWNSSDLTVELEQENGRLAIKHPAAASMASELVDSVDESIVFKPVDFGPLRRRISESISKKFTAIMGGGRTIRIGDCALDKLVGGVWLGGVGFEEWAERVLVPSIEQLRSKLTVDDGAMVFRLSSVTGGGRLQRGAGAGNWLPSKVTIRVDGVGGV